MKAKIWLVPFALSIIALALGFYENVLLAITVGCFCIGVSLGVIMAHNLFLKAWIKKDFADSLQVTGESK